MLKLHKMVNITEKIKEYGFSPSVKILAYDEPRIEEEMARTQSGIPFSLLLILFVDRMQKTRLPV